MIKEHIIETYEDVLSGSKTKFPSGFWSTECDNILRICIEYIIVNKLNKSIEDIKDIFSIKFIRKYRLYTPYVNNYHSNIFEMLDALYPGKFNAWELKYCTRKPSDEVKRDTIRWLFTEKYPFNKQFILDNYNYKFLSDNNIKFMKKDMFKPLDDAFPGMFKPWQFEVKNSYWNESTVIEYVKWYFSEENEFDKEYILSMWSRDYNTDNCPQVRKILNVIFNLKLNKTSILLSAFPEQISLEEIEQVSRNDWSNPKNIAKAVKKVIEKYNFTEDEVYQNFTWTFLHKEGLSALHNIKKSAFDILDIAYPGQYDKERWLKVYPTRK